MQNITLNHLYNSRIFFFIVAAGTYIQAVEEQQESFIYATSCVDLLPLLRRIGEPERVGSIGGLWLSSFVCDLHKMTLGWYISGSKCVSLVKLRRPRPVEDSR